MPQNIWGYNQNQNQNQTQPLINRSIAASHLLRQAIRRVLQHLQDGWDALPRLLEQALEVAEDELAHHFVDKGRGQAFLAATAGTT